MTGVINHPNFGWGLAPRDLAQARRARLVEIFNGHPSTRQRGDERHVSVERAWDIANTVRLGELGGAPLYGVAVDDAHEYHGEPGAQPGRGWVMVQAPTLDAGALVQALDAGDFYASTGVELRSVRFDEETGTLSVEVRPRADARYVIEFIGSTKRAARERPVTRETEGVGVTLSTVPGTRARYVMTGEELYVRARVTSTLPPDNPSFAGQKRQAWTQPVRFERDGEGRLGDAVAGLVESAL
jgi:hypothetical protein